VYSLCVSARVVLAEKATHLSLSLGLKSHIPCVGESIPADMELVGSESCLKLCSGWGCEGKGRGSRKKRRTSTSFVSF